MPKMPSQSQVENQVGRIINLETEVINEFSPNVENVDDLLLEGQVNTTMSD